MAVEGRKEGRKSRKKGEKKMEGFFVLNAFVVEALKLTTFNETNHN